MYVTEEGVIKKKEIPVVDARCGQNGTWYPPPPKCYGGCVKAV